MNFTRTVALLLLAGCPQATPLVLPDPPGIDRFTATPATVVKGGMVTLEWSTSNASQVDIVDVGRGAVAGVDDKRSGSVSVAVNEPSLFVLNAENSRGVKTTALVTVSVEGQSQPTTFAAVPAVISAGAASKLVWAAPGARVVSIAPMGGAAIDLKGQLALGSVDVSPAVTTSYVLTADGATKTVTVSVMQSIDSFTVSKSLADAGEMVTIAWATSNATKVTVSQPGQGTLVTETDAAKVASGSVMNAVPGYAPGTVVPYVLSVEGLGPTLARTAQVVVGTAPAVVGFSGPEYARVGQKFTLSWTTGNADAVELSTGAANTVFYRSVTAAEAASGSLQLDVPAMNTDYTLAAINSRAGVRATKGWTQKVVGATSVTTFTAVPATVANGGDPVTLTWNVPNARHLRIVDSTGHSVASARGPAAETGTRTVYPNGATSYALSADNTLEPAITADAGVAVTTPAAFGASGTVFAGSPFNVSWTVGGGSGLTGFPHPNVEVKAASTGFVDITDGGTQLPFFSTADDSTLSFSPPDFETFLWGARAVPPFTVSTNGFLVLGGSSFARATTVPLPNNTVELNFIAPYWVDLQLNSSSGIFWDVRGEAPERTLIVQFNRLFVRGQPGSEVTFEIKVHQTGGITFEYGALTGVSSVMPVVGVQGPPNQAVVGPLPAASSSLGFMTPAMSPLAVTQALPDVVSGFIKINNGYLRTAFTPTSFVRASELFISEVMPSPHPSISGTGEWFEVTNNSTVAVDLAGFTVDVTGGGQLLIDAGVTLPPRGVLLFGQTEADAGNDNVPVNIVYGGQLNLPDDAGTLTLNRSGFRSSLSWTSDAGPGVSVGNDGQGHLSIGDTTSTPHPISCPSTTTFGSQTPLQRGSPGGATVCIARMQSIPVSYFNIRSSGTALFTTEKDSAVATVSLASAPFPFQGAPVSTAVVSTNGWVILKTYTGVSGTTNKTVPSTTNPSGSLLAPFWDDLAGSGAADSNAYFKRIAAGEDTNNPQPHWIVQWHNVTAFANGNDLNFQVKLFDDGVIEYHYATMSNGATGDRATGSSATVWLENRAGSSALVSSVNQPRVAPNSAIRFTP